MDKIELKNLLFLARINAKEEEYPEIIEKLKNTFGLIDEMQDLDLSDLDEILTTFIVKDLNVSPSDSSYIIASIVTGDTIFKANIQSEVIFSSIDSVKSIGEIKEVIFKAENFEGKLEYQLIKNPNL